jgi:dolichol-phosphate mannosyltransferase
LVRAVLRAGDTVHLLLRQGHKAWRLADIKGDVQTHEVDLQDRDGVRQAVRQTKPDRVFHLAAYGAYSSQTDMERMIATNLAGCVNLLEACIETGVRVFVQTGSSSEYGYKDHPARECEALQPNSQYAITKAAATHYCQFRAHTADIKAVTGRLYSIYGPYEEPTRLIPTLVLHGLEQRLPPLVSPRIARDFVYVDDAVNALLAMADSADRISQGAVFNVCSGIQTTIEDVVREFRQLTDIPEEPVWSTMPDRCWDTSTWVGDPSAIAQALGWRPKVDIRLGLRSTLCWFEENPQMLEAYRRDVFRRA